ncbi:uncharacterized protein LOC116926690 [Daphnia magna]|uniref:uncharacterized protein LOC116926690 n=1 Tax=Daphnia magna TaxID=35525 RepID=UPI001E1BB29A|nr:uncharacterized protein LOC116926690 [Daphnia magna]
MFLRSLSQMSTQNGRPCKPSYINPILFSKAYDENNLMRYRIQNEVLLYKPDICWACGEHPIALHVDGNLKCYRCITAKGFETDPLFQDIMIASDKDVKEFLDLIKNVIPPQSKNKENCGAAVYQAAKTTSSSMKGLDETGLLIMSCRHGWVWRELNLFMGETYRYVLYLHEYAKDKNVRFFCSDVVCQYWIFLLKVTQTEELRERFEGLITLTIDFLSRWHGKTHA